MFKNENGFSLVELAIAAGLAVALAATAVTILSGTTATLSSKANGAAGTSTTYNSDVLANASGAAGTGSQTPDNGGNTTPTVNSVTYTLGTAFSGAKLSSDYAGTKVGPSNLNWANGAGFISFDLFDGTNWVHTTNEAALEPASLVGKNITIVTTQGTTLTATVVSATLWGTPKSGLTGIGSLLDSGDTSIQSITING